MKIPQNLQTYSMPDYSEDHAWTDAEKAQWILENQWDQRDITYIYERVGDQVYRRPMDTETLPPWMSRQREPHMQFSKPVDPDNSGPNFVVTDSEHTAKQHYTTIFGKITDK